MKISKQYAVEEMKSVKGPTIAEMVSDLIEHLVKEKGFTDFLVLPSRLPDAHFVFARKEGAAAIKSIVAASSVEENAQSYVEEIDDFDKSVRIFRDNPAESSLYGKPVVWEVQRIQAINERFVDRDGESVIGVFVATEKSLRYVESKGGRHPFDAVLEAAKLYNPEAIIVSHGGYERSLVAPYDRTGVELVMTSLLAPDGTILVSLKRGYIRKGDKVIWQPAEDITQIGKESEKFETRVSLAWRRQTTTAA